MATTPTKNFVILGMHRSATSLVSRAIAQQGFTCRNEDDTFGDKNNPWGYWEDSSIWRLNDRILAKAGGGWLEPPPREKIIEQRDWAGEEIGKLMAERYPEDGWVIKEPRLALTFDLWYPHFKARRAEFVLIHRARHEILASLQARDATDTPAEVFERCIDHYFDELRRIAAFLYRA